MIAHQKPLRDVALFSHACMQVFVVLVDHFPRACRPCCGCPSPRSLGKTCATTVRRRCCSRRCSTRRPRGQRRRCGRGGSIVRALPIQVFLMESSSWSLPHGRRCRFIVVRARLHESSRRSRRPLSKGMVGAVHRECAPGGAAPPPFDSNGVSFFSRLPKIQKRTFWGHSVNLSGPCCVPLGKASFYPNVTSIISEV